MRNLSFALYLKEGKAGFGLFGPQSKILIQNWNQNVWNNKAFVPLTWNQSLFRANSYSTASNTATQSQTQKEASPNVLPEKIQVLTLHCVPRGRCIPSPSPFVMKVWTYLHMAQIPHKIDTKKPFGPKGKSPWITVDGKDIGDSQLIIEQLSKKFNKKLGPNSYSPEELAVSRTVRIMLEERTFWGATLWRLSDEGSKTMGQVFKVMDSPIGRLYMKYYFGPKMKHYAWAQGMGRHSPEEIQQFVTEDLRTVSIILGSKKYILGDSPCEDDCGIFGFLAQTLWGSGNDCPYYHLINEDLTNLKSYCERIKHEFWADWDNQLARSK